MHMARANRMIYDMIIETLSKRDVTMGLARDNKSGVVFKVKKSGMECIYWKEELGKRSKAVEIKLPHLVSHHMYKNYGKKLRSVYTVKIDWDDG